MSAITLENVSLSFAAKPQPFTVLEDINLSLNRGEFVVLLGPSGCGKSTILNLVAGFNQPDRGRVVAGGKTVKQPGPDRGMIFQQPNLFPWLSVLENVTFGPRLGKHRKDETNAQAQLWLERVGLKGFEHHAPWQLSGGMKQRVALARAWLPGPEVLLLDEPFGALDAQTRLMMQELLREAWLSTGTTLLFVTHDVEEALFLADRILIMSAKPGKIVDEISLPFGRERDIETLAEHPLYSEIKHHVLHRVRQEARRHLR
ncbi:ABC transporter ATP-binding protein [Citrobacter amalonaticus]|jgi:NitT/TauT family transport system ATP-binding protein|uniref:ABC transporter ATP-binding protein n=1 Tax=Citrobacter amalonaticus TaxID=35703 RepID=A0A8I0SY04_CITAM|nr:ABC transporter ATP-binding protein [Citrobacter amalonaticus]HAT6801742.1 ATP-binding cassette domain-containing protein [Citrobacter freundii]AMG92034.1 ABC transporter ATP-binding protein [Citrobacter amalonaticus]EKW2927601.1 ABC transporter ATP-binding protein [Citrobacter amalonaticus]ELK6624525.1 ABC transporter ATP-binding protein [Citrobacter amalonaticus]MBE0128069.1 ABC transporter ATP-binding protein [Citrobacter amalonaticus]